MTKKYTSLEHAIRKVHINPQYKKINEDFEYEMARVGSTFPLSAIGNKGIVAFSDNEKNYLNYVHLSNDKCNSNKNLTDYSDHPRQ